MNDLKATLFISDDAMEIRVNDLTETTYEAEPGELKEAFINDTVGSNSVDFLEPLPLTEVTLESMRETYAQDKENFGKGAKGLELKMAKQIIKEMIGNSKNAVETPKTETPTTPELDGPTKAELARQAREEKAEAAAKAKAEKAEAAAKAKAEKAEAAAKVKAEKAKAKAEKAEAAAKAKAEKASKPEITFADAMAMMHDEANTRKIGSVVDFVPFGSTEPVEAIIKNIGMDKRVNRVYFTLENVETKKHYHPSLDNENVKINPAKTKARLAEVAKAEKAKADEKVKAEKAKEAAKAEKAKEKEAAQKAKAKEDAAKAKAKEAADKAKAKEAAKADKK